MICRTGAASAPAAPPAVTAAAASTTARPPAPGAAHPAKPRPMRVAAPAAPARPPGAPRARPAATAPSTAATATWWSPRRSPRRAQASRSGAGSANGPASPARSSPPSTRHPSATEGRMILPTSHPPTRLATPPGTAVTHRSRRADGGPIFKIDFSATRALRTLPLLVPAGPVFRVSAPRLVTEGDCAR